MTQIKRLVAIGNFDGVHRGHQFLLQRVLDEASELRLVPTVLTFEPHPAIVLGRSMPPPLTSLARKRELIAALSPELEVVVEPFNAELSNMSPEQFVEHVLVRRHAVGRVIVGQEFRFGKGRQGNLARLQGLGAEHGFSAACIELETHQGNVISSSRIRAELTAAQVQHAAELLGRPHSVAGVVVRGAQLGRSLGFPTANLSEVQEMLPATGVYVCRVSAANDVSLRWGGVANLGYRPTVSGGAKELRLEVNLFQFSGDLYGQSLRVEFLERLRGEQAFSGLDPLKQQIGRDVEAAQAHLANLS